MKILPAILFFGLAVVTSAMTPEDAQRSLSGDQGLVLKQRAPLKGQAVRIDGDQLVFAAQRGGGSLEYRYALDEIERLQFPGNDVAYAVTELLAEDKVADALPLMRMLYEQRQNFLPLLSPGEFNFFYRYAELEFRQGDPYLGIGRAQALARHTQDPALKRQLEDLILLGHYRLPLEMSAREKAGIWIQTNPPYGSTALGFYVLGRLEFDEEQYESALMRALEPVAFSSQLPMDYLGYCYALAIASCVELDAIDEERKLRAEMAQRGISWPDIEDLAKYQHPANPLTEEPES